jgi:hypothetical protein
MYFEEVADITAEHLRQHIQAYLDIINARYPDQVQMVYPKSIETNNLVGGVYNAKTDEMPAYALDLISKNFAGVSPTSLWEYEYTGHIAGVVSGNSEEVVNKLCKRHLQAVEMFMKKHKHMHQTESALGNDFRIGELDFAGAAMSGAELWDEEDSRQTWVAGFRVDISILVSEDGPSNDA